MKAKRQQTKQVAHTHIIPDPYNGGFRIWNSWNAGDQFDIVPPNRAEEIRAFSLNLGIPTRDGFPEDDSGETVCDLCLKNKAW